MVLIDGPTNMWGNLVTLSSAGCPSPYILQSFDLSPNHIVFPPAKSFDQIFYDLTILLGDSTECEHKLIASHFILFWRNISWPNNLRMTAIHRVEGNISSD